MNEQAKSEDVGTRPFSPAEFLRDEAASLERDAVGWDKRAEDAEADARLNRSWAAEARQRAEQYRAAADALTGPENRRA